MTDLLLGVFVMVMFGNGSVAQVLLSEKDTAAPGGMGFGQYQSISWGSVFSLRAVENRLTRL